MNQNFRSSWSLCIAVSLLCLMVTAPACKQLQTKKTTKKPMMAQSALIPDMPLADTPTPSLLASSNESFLPQQKPTPQQTASEVLQPPLQKTPTYDADNPKELDFEVANKTGKTVYITCFAYQRKRDFGNWRWDKSPVYKLEQGQVVAIDVDTIPDEQDRKYLFGYLGVFNDEQTALDATYELTDDRSLLDLDQLNKLKGKRVTLEIESYGFRGQFFEYDFVDKSGEKKMPKKLDFPVENKTGTPIYVVGFVYEKKAKGKWIDTLPEKDDMSVWRFDKTPIVKLLPGETGMIELDPIASQRDINYLRGYLAVFDADEEEEAKQATYELLESSKKFHLGEIARLANRKIVIEIEKYGMMQDFVDFVIKPVRRIDFTKIHDGKK